MQTKLYVGNLNYNSTEEDIRPLFEKFGTIQSIEVIKDRHTGQSKGFAFVQMSTPEEAQKALELSGADLMGRALNVSEARPQEPRRGGGGGGGYGHRGGGGGFGNKRGGGGFRGGRHGGDRDRGRDRGW